MSQEQTPNHSQPLLERDPYEIAFAVAGLLLEYFQAKGEMTRLSDIENEFELDEHFDQLARHYRWVCSLMELPWPPQRERPADDTSIS